MFRRIHNQFLRYFLILIYFFIIFFCAIELNFLWLFGYSPDMQDIKTPVLSVGSEVFTADGKLIGQYYKENRSPVEFNKISPNLINALVATEDHSFYSHNGVDFLSFFSSMVSTAKGDKRGGSTITQQLAKNLFSTRKKKSQGFVKHIPVLRTVVYKFKEWLTAFKIEHVYSKQQIITLYFNTVPFGNNSFGIKTATLKYFNKQPNEVNPAQAATLIGMLKATSTYNPIRNPERSVERRNIVLSQMKKYGYLKDADYAVSVKQPLVLDLSYVDEDSHVDSYLRQAVEKWLDKWCKDNDYDLYEDGLKIYTTIDSRLQQYAEEAVAEKMKSLQKRFNNVWGKENPWRDSKGEEIKDFILKNEQRLPIYRLLVKKYKGDTTKIQEYFNTKKRMKVFTWNNGTQDTTFSTIDSIRYYARLLNTGMMTLEPSTGKIKVWVGGIDYKFFNYDHVKQAKRQAGSTFKPFAYLTALDNGYTPCDKFTDKPVTIRYKDNGKDEEWSPKNADFSFSYREMSLRWAMGRSVNSITAQLTEKVGWDKIVEYAHKCGIESPLKSVPSVSLGSNDVSVYEMVRAYSTFLNKGEKIDPLLVTKITDNRGNVIQEFELKSEKVLSEETAWLMLYMFRGGMEEPGGTSQALWDYDIFKKNNQIGGKTGTSSDYVDGWYMGITKDLVTGIWVGADDRSVHFKTSQTGEGSRTALPIFGRFMEKVYGDPKSGYTYGAFPKPWTKITKTYDCPSPRIVIDTTATDSLDMMEIDTTGATPIIPTPENQDGELPPPTQ